MVRLICALPNPGCPGIPRGLFYKNTPAGHKRAEEFARTEDRPGWGVFDCPNPFKDSADLQTFSDVLEANGWKR
jgi:hypothetical protein